MIRYVYYGLLTGHVILNVYEYLTLAHTTYKVAKLTCDGVYTVSDKIIGCAGYLIGCASDNTSIELEFNETIDNWIFIRNLKKP
jgi:hypothetical protein